MRVVDAGAAAERNQFSAVLRLDLLHLGGDEFDRLVPTHLPPFALALFTEAHQRMIEASRMIELLDRGGPRFRAQCAPVDRVVAIADHLPDGAVDPLDNGAAAAVAHAADGLDLLDDFLAERAAFGLKLGGAHVDISLA